MEQVRSFIAIELPEEAKRLLQWIQAELKAGGSFPVKWVDPQSIHLTLQFLGNVDAARIEKIQQVMKDAAKGIAPFRLQIGEPGVFPNPKRPRVVWVGVTGDLEQLGLLQKRIESGLAPLGFLPEKRDYTPHLTLGRVREQASAAEQQALGKIVTETRPGGSGAFTVSAVNLMRSQLTRDGAVYSITGSITLKQPC